MLIFKEAIRSPGVLSPFSAGGLLPYGLDLATLILLSCTISWCEISFALRIVESVTILYDCGRRLYALTRDTQ